MKRHSEIFRGWRGLRDHFGQKYGPTVICYWEPGQKWAPYRLRYTNEIYKKCKELGTYILDPT
jgi:hypothetical protein